MALLNSIFDSTFCANYVFHKQQAENSKLSIAEIINLQERYTIEYFDITLKQYSD